MTGPPYFQTSGNYVVWGTKNLQYWTDAGDLSATVNHAAADAMVATAAGAWNVPVAAMTVSQGGVLREDVSGSNVSMGAGGPVFPGDVQSVNAAAVPVAVIYDADGAVTDLLLGGGASDPGNCRQTAVTESVDGITAAGKITHAVLVLNGRCTGADPALQMEMTYRLVRAFGRVLGLGWSQLNDNVFTGYPLPTIAQALHWPIMHPMDVMCGPYAYQCVPQPFTIRMDDVAAMVGLYPETGSDAGKTNSFTEATPYVGTMTFPNGQGMAGVNVVAWRHELGGGKVTDAFEAVSGVTGARFQLAGATAVGAKGTGMAASFGSAASAMEGRYDLPWVPIDTTLYTVSNYYQNVMFKTQAVNPLYTGQYAVGPYGGTAQVLPSGSAVTYTDYGRGPIWGTTVNLPATDAVASCGASGDGTAAAPVAVDASGMWQGVMCGYGHTAWSKVAVKAGRTLTVEVTAVDEQGLATVGKMQPVLGVWAGTDAVGVAPTVGSVVMPMNTMALGTTGLTVSNATARTLRIGLGDQRGDGRPDYGYRARVLYADSVTPAVLPADGGTVTIAGMGFRNGNAVMVNGVAAQVMSWSANQIVAVAPAMVGAVTADVTVVDGATGGQTTVQGAIAYSGTSLPNRVAVVSVPADGSLPGVEAQAMFGVRVMLADAVSPAVGVGVGVSATNGAGLVGCGGASQCTLMTDGGGMARTAVVPAVGGMVDLGAQVGTVSAAASFMAGSRPADVLRVTSLPIGTVFAGVPALLPLIVQVSQGDGVTPDAGAQVAVGAQGAGLGGCGGSSNCVLTADGLGLVATTVTPSGGGLVSLTASAGGGAVSASFGAVAMPADVLRVVSIPMNGTFVGSAAGFGVQVLLGDGVTVAAGARVTLMAIGGGWEACGGASTCAVTADAAGMVTARVTPGMLGTVTLSAGAGGGTVYGTFTTATAPLDRMEIVSSPASGAMVGSRTGAGFSVRLLLPDGVTPVAGVGVTLTATGATLGSCGAATCVVMTDGAGGAGSSVTPLAAGVVRLGAAFGSVGLTETFTAVADSVRVVSLPVMPAYVGVPTRSPVVMQVLGPDGVTPAAGVSATMTTTLGTLGACGMSSCTMTTDGQGMVSSLVTPAAKGVVTIRVWAGGGTGGTSFNVLAMPPDVLRLVSIPSGSAVYVGVNAVAPVTVQAFLGDGVNVDAGAQIRMLTPLGSMSANNCGQGCMMTADAQGMVTTAIRPLVSGTVTLTALVGYQSTLVASFTAYPMPVDVLTVVSGPADGTMVGTVAAAPFAVRTMLGDGLTVAANAMVTLTATGGRLGMCGAGTCPVRSDAHGMVSTTVTPTVAGVVTLGASAGGGTVSAQFTAVAQPDVVRVVSMPADGALAGRAAGTAFQVKVMLADGMTAAAGVGVTLTASGATLGACGAASCTVAADASGMVSTTVTPMGAGVVGLAATAAGGSAAGTFRAVLPPDTVTVVSVPGNGAYVGRVADGMFGVKVLGWDGVAVAGVPVTLTASGGVLGACGGASCVVVADASGAVSTTVTPTAAGVVGLTAAAGGGSGAGSFTAVVVPPAVVTVVSVPANGGYVGRVASGTFGVKVVLGDGAVGAGVPVTLTAANGLLGACGAASCVVVADASGVVSTTVTPSAAGVVGLTAAAGGGSVAASFTAMVMPADVLTVTSVPGNGAYVGRVAAGVFGVKVVLGDGAVGTGVPVTLTASGGLLGACGASSCMVTADASGMVSTSVTPSVAGTIGLTAAAGGGSASGSFTAVVVPADVLTVMSVPGNGAFVNRVAGTFGVKVVLGDGAVGAGVPVTLTASGGLLGVCGSSSCVVTADASGIVSTSVTPSVVGTVGLTAAAGGGGASGSFTAVAVPADMLTVMSVPGNGAFVSRVAGTFGVKVVLGDGAVGAGVPVTLTASGGLLGACGSSSCVVTADALGMVSTSVTPSAAGTVGLTATAGGGTAIASFLAVVVPADVLTVTSVPANGAFVGRVAGTFGVRVMLGDGTTGAGVPVTLTASGGVLSVCGSASCTVVADALGAVTTAVVPSAAGVVSLSAAAGGGSVSASFTTVNIPADVLMVMSTPASGGYAGRVAGGVFGVKTVRGDGSSGAGVAVTVTVSNGVLGACGAVSCVLTADGAGMVTTTVTPSAAGGVGLSATAGGGSASATFTAAAMPADGLMVTSVPANGAYVGRPAGVFGVKVVLGDGTVGVGVAVTLSASGGVLGACGAASCVVVADAAGMVTTTVTPSAAGVVGLAAAAGGGSAAGSFTAVLAPDEVAVISVPGNGAFAGRVAAGPFAVKVLRWDGTAAVGASVTLTASNGVLGACGAASCTVAADAAGMVSTAVTPSTAGVVGLAASAGGGSASGSFTAVPMPADVLTVVAVPASGGYPGRAASGVFGVRVALGDGTAGAGVPVTLTASGGVLGACGASSCVVVADSSGMVSTAVTPSAAGVVGLVASAGGGSASASFTAVAMPADGLTVVSMPGSGGFVGEMAAGVWRVRVMLGDGVTAAAGAPVTLTSVGGMLGACGGASCVVTADASGMVGTTVMPQVVGSVGLRAEAGGGFVTSSLTAVDHVRALTMTRAVEYVAAGARVGWTAQAVATMDGVVQAAPVSWTGGAGMVVDAGTGGAAGVVAGPLGAGGTATGQACVWGTVCADFEAVVVDPAEWGIAMVSGGEQAAAVGGGLDPVVVRVVDGAGHGVAGAAVTVRQGVSGYVSCPGAGRCPVGPALGAGSSVVVSDADGLAQVMPLVVGGVGETTGMVFTAGENGFLSTAVSLVP